MAKDIRRLSTSADSCRATRGCYHPCTVVELLVAFALAVGAGGLGALVGIGGGIVVVPVLTVIIGVPIKTAIAASLSAVIATSTAAAAPYLSRGMADRRIGLVLLVATAAGGVTGGLTAGYLNPRVLAGLFGLILILAVAQMVRGMSRARGPVPAGAADDAPVFMSSYVEPATNEETPFPVRRIPAGVAISLVAGNVSGLLGVGGGVINVPTMNVVMGVPLRVATTTSTYMLGATAVASGILYYSRGQVDPLVAAPVALGVFVGARVASRLAHRVRQDVLQWVFIAIALVFAAQMFARAAGVA
jgi:uncharacterized membrane protein YfcA